jgi:DNA-binding NtrC family response regulator
MCRILIVDDEQEVRDTLTRRLEREGHAVESAASQEEGATKIREAPRPYDVVLTDMLMEDADSGIAILREAMARDLFTEVIVLTAYGNVANAVECMKRGAFDYVEKNIPGVDVFDLIVLKIDQAMDRRRQAATTLRRLEDFQRATQA